jgi:hypothetical protein
MVASTEGMAAGIGRQHNAKRLLGKIGEGSLNNRHWGVFASHYRRTWFCQMTRLDRK